MCASAAIVFVTVVPMLAPMIIGTAFTIGRGLSGAATKPTIIAVVTDEPDKYPINAGFAPDVTIHHRDDLDALQRDLRRLKGVSVLIYDQTCAAEKRRRRKKGKFPLDQRSRKSLRATAFEIVVHPSALRPPAFALD